MDEYIDWPQSGNLGCSSQRPPVEERLKEELRQVTKRRAEIEEALEILARNPDVKRLLEILR